MILETERLILRPWREDDAEDLFLYAQDPRVGPSAGWPPHTSVENSREIILTILSAADTFAVVPKSMGHAAGSIGLTIGAGSSLKLPADEAEIGFWIGVPFWGQGLIPEAVRALARYGFEGLDLKKIWAGYFDGNAKSRRAQEKSGFVYSHTLENLVWKPTGEVRTEHVTLLTREKWQELNKLSKRAGSQAERKI